MVNLRLPDGFQSFNPIGYIVFDDVAYRTCNYLTNGETIIFVYVYTILKKIKEFKLLVVEFIQSLEPFGFFFVKELISQLIFDTISFTSISPPKKVKIQTNLRKTSPPFLNLF